MVVVSWKIGVKRRRWAQSKEDGRKAKKMGAKRGRWAQSEEVKSEVKSEGKSKANAATKTLEQS